MRGKTRTHTRQAIQETDSPGGGRITIIALDVQSLDQATRILEENTIYQGRVAGLYGAGSTTSLLRALDKGIVTGMTAYNQFDEGYLSVKQAVEAIQGTRQKQQTMLEAIYVDEDRLRDKTYEKNAPIPLERGPERGNKIRKGAYAVKGKWMYLLAACMGAAVLIGVWQYMGREDGRKADKNSVRIGVLLYRGTTPSSALCAPAWRDKAKEYEQETGIKVKLDIMDAKGSQNTQNSQVERLISLGCDALCINSVDRSSASIIIDKAMDAGTPVVFFNREPVEEDMNRLGKAVLCGSGRQGIRCASGETSWWMPIIRIHEPWMPTATVW